MNSKSNFGIIATLIAVCALGVAIFLVSSVTGAINNIASSIEQSVPNSQHVGADGDTNLTNLVLEGNLTVQGTSTVAHSPDGFMLWDDFTVGTTTPVRAALTNSGSPLMCDEDSLYVYADAKAAFAPSFKFAVGLATAATSYAADIIASTTVATTTDTTTGATTPVPVLLASGSSFTLSVGDYVAAIASSTYYGNWSGQFGIFCWTLGQ
jgi:hypothetical protein